MQTWSNIAGTDLVSESRDEILERDETLKSNFSGTVFPSADLVVGMSCYRTDQSKLYVLESTGPSTWREVALLHNLSTAVSYNIGTSGATIPLNNTANTFSETITFSNATLAISLGANKVGGTTGDLNFAGSNVTLNANSTRNIIFSVNSVTKMQVYADGGVVVGGATGASQGNNTLNVASLYINGSVLGTASTKNTGTASGQVPLNSDLGALAYLDTVGTSQVDNDAITLAKMAHGTSNRLLGYDGSGVPVEITAGTGITISAGSVSVSSVSIEQGDLNTSTGSVNKGTSTGRGHFTLPGGTYGFYPQVRREISGTGHEISFVDAAITLGTSFVTNISLYTGNSVNMYAQQRYMNASPPIILGGDEAAGFMYLLIEKDTKDIHGMYSSDVPPWLYNGPTYARADYISGDKIKYRHKQGLALGFISELKAGNKKARFNNQKPKSFQEYLNERSELELVPRISRIRSELSQETFMRKRSDILTQCLTEIKDSIIADHFEEITQEIKNADMNLIPHPFPGYNQEKYEIVMVGLYCDLGRDLIDAQNAGADISDLIYGGYLKLDGDFIQNKFAPPGVKLLRCRLK